MSESHGGQLWRIIERYIDGFTYPPSERAVAKKMGIKATTMNNWKHATMTRLPDVDHLEAIARVTGVPYEEVMDAALADTGYLPVRKRDQPSQRRGKSS
ncbi:MAG TPA: helix-turn-helix transcriptional regulator [Jiangellaceae bacterium]|nr:helix-turn-helix transcriptional regulator [Jiangellaceae bacterium]